MKKLIVALALVAGAQAQAEIAAPLFGCELHASLTQTIRSVELLIVRAEAVTGPGTVICTDAVNRQTAQNVQVIIESAGIGPAINLPLVGSDIYAVRAGAVTMDGMAGKYRIGVGPRLGLIGGRANIMPAVQVSGEGAGLGVEIAFEERFSIGLDLSGTVMTVKPTSKLIRVR